IGVEPREELAPEHEEATAHDAVDPRLLTEAVDALAARALDDAEARIGRHAGDGADAALLQMEIPQRSEVDVRQTVAVRGEEMLALDVLLDAENAPARHRFRARVGADDLPVFRRAVAVQLEARLAAPARGEVVIHGAIVEHPLLDDLHLVTQAQDETA